MQHILLCQKCNKYTLQQKCSCGEKPVLVIPMKYTPNDKYASYRREALKPERQKKGLL